MIKEYFSVEDEGTMTVEDDEREYQPDRLEKEEQRIKESLEIVHIGRKRDKKVAAQKKQTAVDQRIESSSQQKL